MPRALIAFDKFKHSLSAPEACRIAAAVLAETAPEWTVETCPLTDGGEGFAEILTQAAGGEWVPVTVTGPRGVPVPAGFGVVETTRMPAAVLDRLGLEAKEGRRIALVEMALASGIELLKPAERDPWLTDTAGTGELLAAAAAQGVAGILLGVGGSATNDLGLGALGKLGIQAIDTEGAGLPESAPGGWERLAGFRGGLPAGFPPMWIACDVTNPVLGPRGCTAVYGPQKGLKPGDYERMESALARVSARLCAHFGRAETLREQAGAGAAGGVGFGLACVAPSTAFVAGADLVSDWLRVVPRLEAADLVITGEGRFDGSSLTGKGPGMIVRLAAERGKRVWLLCGSVESGVALPPGVEARAITPAGMPLEEALPLGGRLLAETVRGVAGKGGVF